MNNSCAEIRNDVTETSLQKVVIPLKKEIRVFFNYLKIIDFCL